MSVTSRINPDPTAACALVNEGFERTRVITVVGRCEVDYDGRTTSYLGYGDRIVLLKPDGTLLVHQPDGRDPVNWQPPGCVHEAHVRDDRLYLRSERAVPEETVSVRFDAIYQVSTLTLTDGREILLVGSEADLRRRILDDPALVEAGFTPLATERDTVAGAVDIYGVDAEGTPVVVELKRRRVGPDAVGQLARYVEAVERERTGGAVRGILVAPSVTERAERLLAAKGLEHVTLEAVRAIPTLTTLDDFDGDRR